MWPMSLGSIKRCEIKHPRVGGGRWAAEGKGKRQKAKGKRQKQLAPHAKIKRGGVARAPCFCPFLFGFCLFHLPLPPAFCLCSCSGILGGYKFQANKGACCVVIFSFSGL